MRTRYVMIFWMGLLVIVGCTELPTVPNSPPTVAAEPPSPAPPEQVPWLGGCNLELWPHRFTQPFSNWQRTSSDVFIRNRTLFIQPGGSVDDGMVAPCTQGSPWTYEVTGRLISGGNNYVFPHIYGQFTDGRWFLANLLPDLGWLLMVCTEPSWLPNDIVPGHTAPEICSGTWDHNVMSDFPSEGDYLTLRVVATGTHLQVFIKREGDISFTLGREIEFSTDGLVLKRVGVSQPWDSHIEVTGMRMY